MTRRTVTLLCLAGLIGLEGLIAARIGFASFAFQSAVLMLASGWATAGSGLVAWCLSPASRIGPLLFLAGATAFIGAFTHVRWDVAADVAARLAWLHVAVLAQAVLTHPDGRIRGSVTRVLVVGMYALALVSPPRDAAPLALALALGVAVVLRRLVVGRDPRRGSADLAGFLAAGGLAGGPLLCMVAPGVPLNGSALRYAGLAAAAVLLAADAVRSSPARTFVTDAVLRLDPTAPTSVVAELRRATGDPTLEVGFLAADGRAYVDPSGKLVAMPAPGSGRAATAIDSSREASAVVVHDERLDTLGVLSASGARAIELESANARLQALLRAQVADVRTSRRRIVEAGDAARGALERRLAAGLLPGLDALERCLGDLVVGGAGRDGEPIDALRRGLAEVRVELVRLADGLYPSALEELGLAGALERLAGRCSVPVGLTTAPLPALPPGVVSTAWFVCSEALTNVAKHARATSVAVSVAVEDGRLAVEIADDGVGGADPAGGSGLRGLRDRVDALGGSLRLDSAAGSGTLLRAELPVAVT